MSHAGPLSSQPTNGIFALPDNYDRRIRHVAQLLALKPSLRSRDLASLVGVTPAHLERLFKRQVGMSIGQFSLELRLQRAKQLLETTFRCLKEIRHEVAITDAANFSRLFKKRFSMTPTTCRRHATMSVLTNKYQN
jgi:transcriptional regulator GlxA family with amidase domain